jgi:hypothetical protein
VRAVTRDPLKVLATAGAVLVVAKVVARTYFPGFISGFLDLAVMFAVGTLVILTMMRMNGKL